MPDVIAGPERDPEGVRAMFDDIAPRYDLANTAMTLGMDRRWRRLTAQVAVGRRPSVAALDCACGTGRLAAALLAAGAGSVVAVDFSPQMLAIARTRYPRIEFVLADLRQLPYPDASFDAVSIGFGLRNLPDPDASIREMTRVLRRGGRLVILEAVRPEGFARPALRVAATVVPRIAGRLAGNPEAYRYLSETVRTYASADDVADWLRRTGLVDVRVRRLGAGAAALVWGSVD